MANFKYPYIWLFCGFAALGACLYGYDGVYFNGASSLRECGISLQILQNH